MKNKQKYLLYGIILVIVLLVSLVFYKWSNNKSWNENVRLLGRTYCDGDAIVLDYTCSGIEFFADFRKGGGEVTITFADGEYLSNEHIAYMGVYINDSDEASLTIPINGKGESVVIYQTEEKELVKIKVVKLSEAKYGVAKIDGVAITKGQIMATENKEMNIEVIGDSITCGNNNARTYTGKETFATVDENGYMSYGAILARKMDADVNIVAYSGVGIWRSNEKLDITMPDIYEQVSPNNAEEWDFNEYKPGWIIINLGTNDAKYIYESENEFKEAYSTFLRTVLELNKEAKIVCCIGPMRYDAEQYIKECVEEIESDRVYFFAFSKGEGGHPYVSKHVEMAEELYEYIINIGAEMNAFVHCP